MRLRITQWPLSALIGLTACGALSNNEKSTSANGTNTRTSTSTASTTATSTNTSGQLSTVTIDASGAANTAIGSKLLVTVTPLNQGTDEERILTFDLPATGLLSIPNLAAKSYKFSMKIVDETGKISATTELPEVQLSAGAAPILKIKLTKSVVDNVLTVLLQPKNETESIADKGPFEFVRDYGCVPVEKMLICKDSSVPTEKVTNERCRAKNPCSTKNESCEFSRMVCQDGSLADGTGATIHMSCQPQGTDQIGGQCDSSARVKRDIHYLTIPERQQLSDAILNTKLSKYYYKDSTTHDKSQQLGFIIEDQPANSVFVNDEKTRVNLYAFTSGAVAAIQQLRDELIQQQEIIKRLEDELRRMKESK